MAKAKLVDRLFARAERHWKILLPAAVLAILVAWWNQDALKAWADPNEAFFKVMALVFGPPVTAIGFYLGYRSKQDMVELHGQTVTHSKGAQDRLVELAKELSDKSIMVGRLESSLSSQKIELEQSKIELDRKDEVLKAERTRVDKLTCFRNSDPVVMA